ncbi:hypothetical protein [Dictyobacter aurantiacus]|uniref:Uncharacterized protein n=1 Tax=Dictyobacter aurantiacus TaxID=1936993 RepID=A0A401ZEG5_9CHLR|nr:hypothetical protein [Dictyobacter aurantiacus]GCE05270.1 hypothetical protein KDAU_25990 [Dictyobacter aurantiacus]
MDARFYNLRDQEINIETLANNLVNAYQSQGYTAQYIGNGDHVLVQFKKGSDFEAFIGLQAALSLSLQRTNGGIMATIGQQKWIDKMAVGAAAVFVPALFPLLLTAGFGAFRQFNLAGQIFSMLDGLVRQQYPDVQINPTAQASAF